MRSPQTVKNANQHHQSINSSAKNNKSAIDNMNIIASASSHKEVNIKMLQGGNNHGNSSAAAAAAAASISNHHSQTHLFEARRLSQQRGSAISHKPPTLAVSSAKNTLIEGSATAGKHGTHS